MYQASSNIQKMREPFTAKSQQKTNEIRRIQCLGLNFNLVHFVCFRLETRRILEFVNSHPENGKTSYVNRIFYEVTLFRSIEV